MIQIFKNVVLLFCLLGVVNVQANIGSNPLLRKTEYTKEIKKSFNISANGTVELSNKYGKINLKTWNKEEVNIAVTITVKSRSESSANNIFDRINIDFSNSLSRVSAITEIESQKSSWWGDGDKGDFRIDYEVSIPDAASLELSNKYGDSFIEAIGGNADVSVKYGNFDLKGVAKSSKIYLGYGSGTVGDMQNLEANINYSKFKVEKTSSVTIESKYSKIYIDEAGNIQSQTKYDSYDLGQIRSLENEGKYDHYEIKSAEKVRSESKYSNFEIDELGGQGIFDLKYGGVIIEDLQSGFELVSIDGSHSNGKIYLEDKVAFRLDASCEYGAINYPSGMKVEYESKKDHRHSMKGSRGSGGGMIKANLSYGGLKVR